MEVTISEFKPPEGINFSCRNLVPVTSLSKDLCRIAAVLQGKYPYVPLQRFEDWWQHDGLHFNKGMLDWHEIFEIVGSPQGIYESMPRDDHVRIGIAATDGRWYLRFYASWDHDGEVLVGNYDITLPISLADSFRELIPSLLSKVTEETSERYFKRIIV